MAKNLIMFSSAFVNEQILNHLNDMCKSKKRATYIPAGMEYTPFNGKLYQDMGFKYSERFCLAYNYDETKLDELFASDLIHIGGGNTFELRYLLEKRGLIPRLQKFVEDGGVLIGNSAGSIVMCNDIMIANIADRNYTNCYDYTGLSIVNFEFKPHFQAYKNDIPYFETYSELRGTVVYGVSEGGAIIIKNNKFIPIGDVIKIDSGMKGVSRYEL